jgi:hypothetical protein
VKDSSTKKEVNRILERLSWLPNKIQIPDNLRGELTYKILDAFAKIDPERFIEITRKVAKENERRL